MYVINIFSLDMSAKKYAGSNKALRPHRHILNLLNHREEQACCISQILEGEEELGVISPNTACFFKQQHFCRKKLQNKEVL